MTDARRILVIDDSETVLAHLKRVLSAEGYEVITTTQVVGNARFLLHCDLVIIDYHMPGLDGGEIVASLRATSSSTRHVCPLFLYTSDEEIARTYAQRGFDGVFTSKGDDQALLRQIGALFRTLDIRLERERRRSSRPKS